MSVSDRPEQWQGAPWQFKNSEGEIVGEYGYKDFNSIRDDLLSGKLSPELLCRQGKENDFLPIKDSTLAKDVFKIGVLFDPIKAHIRGGAQIGGSVLLGLGFVFILIAQIADLVKYGPDVERIFWMVVGLVIGSVLFCLLGTALGALIGLLVGFLRRSSLQLITPTKVE